MVVGYSLAFTDGGGSNAYVGGLSRFFLAGMGVDAISGTIPESVFMSFQMTFAIITPALIAGAFADRMKFSAMLWFMGLWSIFVYSPICHWVWGGGFLGSMRRARLRRRHGRPHQRRRRGPRLRAGARQAHRLRHREHGAAQPRPVSLIGASLLWVGWFGFNAGSELAADGRAGMAMAVTQIATAAAALAWMFAEWVAKGKPSVLGIVSGAVAGLVAITPASGFVGPIGALVIGIAAGVICAWSAIWLKRHARLRRLARRVRRAWRRRLRRRHPDRRLRRVGGRRHVRPDRRQSRSGLDAVRRHRSPRSSGPAVACFVILKVIDVVIGLRVSPEVEVEGLDINLHGEVVQ